MDEKARKYLSELLRALAARGLEPVAVALGKDVSTVSRWASPAAGSGHSRLEEMALLCAALGLKIVPDDAVTIDPDELHALHVLARARLNRARQAADFQYSEVVDE